jgi:hypothetical protein
MLTSHRLRIIFSAFKGLPIGLDLPRLRAFAHACAQARNDISHFGAQRHGGAYSDFVMDLGKKSRALSTLYHCLLLHEIGVSQDILRKWVYNSIRSFPIKYGFVEVGLLAKARLEPYPSGAARRGRTTSRRFVC